MESIFIWKKYDERHLIDDFIKLERSANCMKIGYDKGRIIANTKSAKFGQVWIFFFIDDVFQFYNKPKQISRTIDGELRVYKFFAPSYRLDVDVDGVRKRRSFSTLNYG